MQLFANMLRLGGIPILVMMGCGIVCTAWVAARWVAAVRPAERLIRLICSCVPAVIGLWYFVRLFGSFQIIADSPIALKKTESDLMISHAIAFGTVAIVFTLLPMGLEAVRGVVRDSSM